MGTSPMAPVLSILWDPFEVPSEPSSENVTGEQESRKRKRTKHAAFCASRLTQNPNAENYPSKCSCDVISSSGHAHALLPSRTRILRPRDHRFSISQTCPRQCHAMFPFCHHLPKARNFVILEVAYFSYLSEGSSF